MCVRPLNYYKSTGKSKSKANKTNSFVSSTNWTKHKKLAYMILFIGYNYFCKEHGCTHTQTHFQVIGYITYQYFNLSKGNIYRKEEYKWDTTSIHLLPNVQLNY